MHDRQSCPVRTLLALLTVLATCGGDGPDDGFGFGTTTDGTSGAAGTTTATTGDGGSSGSGTDGGGSGDGLKLDVGPPGETDGNPEGGGTDCASLDPDDATSIGCEFWAVKASETSIATYGFPWGGWGVGVGNPWLDRTAVVKLEDRRGPGGALREIIEVTLGPGESRMVDLDGENGILAGEQHFVGKGFAALAALRITSDVPISAMQITPVGGAEGQFPEASLLLPSNALRDLYMGLSFGPSPVLTNELNQPVDAHNWITVVATEDGTTANVGGTDVMLDAFDTYRHTDATDLTGTIVSSDRPVAVFAGEEVAQVPLGTSWGDHIEEQVIPLEAWGKEYVGIRHAPRAGAGAEELVYWRLVAGDADVTIQLSEDVGGIGTDIDIPDQGGFVDFSSTEPFVATADKPFMLVQFMAGGGTVGGGSCEDFVGDPYMAQMVPSEQWIEQTPFLTDTSFANDFVSIVRSVGTSVDLACLGAVPDDHFAPIPGTGYELGHVRLDVSGQGGEGACVDGEQFLSASQPVGLVVGGYDCAAAYGYPGGMSFEALWLPPQG